MRSTWEKYLKSLVKLLVFIEYFYLHIVLFDFLQALLLLDETIGVMLEFCIFLLPMHFILHIYLFERLNYKKKERQRDFPSARSFHK